MKLEKDYIITIGGYDINLTETINIILAFFTKIFKTYIPGEDEE